jgi:Phytanoyl-CoA dioxygenase (PhyH)
MDQIHEPLTPAFFERNGCCLLSGVIASNELQHFRDAIDQVLISEDQGVLRSNSVAYGIRNLLQLCPEVADLAKIPRVLDFVAKALGPRFGVVRGLFFDKPPERGWTLPWHRDRTVAIEKSLTGKAKANGFRNLTVKAGVTHAIAPDWLLQQMITLRFSLDPMTADNGPLVFIPGSHQFQSFEGNESELDQDLATFDCSSNSQDIVTQQCDAGDLFVMRPLLAHSSLNSQATTSLRRRVIHLELSPEMPDVPWHQYLELDVR